MTPKGTAIPPPNLPPVDIPPSPGGGATGYCSAQTTLTNPTVCLGAAPDGAEPPSPTS